MKKVLLVIMILSANTAKADFPKKTLTAAKEIICQKNGEELKIKILDEGGAFTTFKTKDKTLVSPGGDYSNSKVYFEHYRISYLIVESQICTPTGRAPSCYHQKLVMLEGESEDILGNKRLRYSLQSFEGALASFPNHPQTIHTVQISHDHPFVGARCFVK